MTITIDGTTGIASVDGSAGSPSVRGSDANSGIVYSADNVAFSTAGTSRANIDSSGDLNVEAGNLNVSKPAIPTILVQNSTDTSYSTVKLQQSSGSGGYFAITKLGTNSSAIGGANAAQLWQSGNAPIVVGVNNAEKARFLSGGGIAFNGDTAAANALDDYEEGTWTPECRIETRAASDSPIDSVQGAYTKVGRLVTCHGQFTLNGTPSETSTSRAIELHGWPFDHNYDWDKVSGDIRVTGWETGSTYGTDIYFLIRMLSGQQVARIELIQQSYNGTRNGSVVMQDNMTVMFTFTYVTT